MEANAQEITQEQKPSEAENTLSREDYKRIIETLLFITDRPLSPIKLSQIADISHAQLARDIVAEIAQEYAQSARVVQIIEIGGGFQMSTKPEYGRWVRKLFNEKTSAKLSNAALETLAIIAYKQPITRAEVEAIRGVDIIAPLEKIMERGLVKITGKKDAPGKPMLYGTTDEFLRLFGLNKIADLPELKEFAAKIPSQLQGDLPFAQTRLEPENETPAQSEADNAEGGDNI
jgi:segregation and condensation protein B